MLQILGAGFFFLLVLLSSIVGFAARLVLALREGSGSLWFRAVGIEMDMGCIGWEGIGIILVDTDERILKRYCSIRVAIGCDRFERSRIIGSDDKRVQQRPQSSLPRAARESRIVTSPAGCIR